MMTFALLSAFERSLFALWSLSLCAVNIGNAVLATVKKRVRYSAFAIALFVPSHFIWQIVFDFSLFEKTKSLHRLTQSLCGANLIIWIACLLILTAASTFLLSRNIKYDKNYINPGTVKIYLDKIPCGICCWRENGRILFSNVCMNELCVAITDKTLLNGNHFRDSIKEDIIEVNGVVRRFTCRKMNVDGEILNEMIASDITAEYAKTSALEADKSRLSKLNRELEEYYLSIDQSVRRREILQAKINIHDEMNRLMLSTVAADKNDKEALDNIFSLWEKNALLLCMEADIKKSAFDFQTLKTLANALGINLVLNDFDMSELSEKQKELFSLTAQEAMINAVKHADAKNIEISAKKEGKTVVCTFANDGNLPEKEVEFVGGLANISLLAKEQNAKIFAKVTNKFSIVLKFFE